MPFMVEREMHNEDDRHRYVDGCPNFFRQVNGNDGIEEKCDAAKKNDPWRQGAAPLVCGVGDYASTDGHRDP